MICVIKLLNNEPEGFSDLATQILKSVGELDNGPFNRNELKKEIEKYNVIIVRLAQKIDYEIIDCAKNLKVISTATTGLNHIDVDYAHKKNIQVLSQKVIWNFLNPFMLPLNTLGLYYYHLLEKYHKHLIQLRMVIGIVIYLKVENFTKKL